MDVYFCSGRNNDKSDDPHFHDLVVIIIFGRGLTTVLNLLRSITTSTWRKLRQNGRKQTNATAAEQHKQNQK